MLRPILPMLLLACACGYSAIVNAASFPPIVDTRTAEFVPFDPYDPIEFRQPEIIVADDSFVDLIEIGDIDKDGIVDYQFQVFTEDFFNEYLNGDEMPDIACPSLYVAASSVVGSSFVPSDAIEVTGLELLYQSPDDFLDCFFSYAITTQPIPDINGDQIDELSFYSGFTIPGGGDSQIGSAVAFVKLELGAVIDLATVFEGVGGFTLANNLRLSDTTADLNGDNAADLVIYEYSDGDYAGEQTRFSVINGAELALVKNLSADTLGDLNVLLDIQSDTYLQLSESADFNGDLFDDLIITSNDGATGSTNYILYGAADISIRVQPGDFDSVLPRLTFCSNCDVDLAGDFNADGFADLVITGAGNNDNNVGEKQIVYGGSQGLPDSLSAANSTQITTTNDIDLSYLSGIGDFNGDGASDLYFDSYEKVDVVLLGQAVADPNDIVVEQLNGENGFLLITPDNIDYFYSIQIKDINNDGFDDIVGEYSNSALLLGRANSDQPVGVQGLSVATGQTMTFLNWVVPAAGSDVDRVEIFVNDALVDTVNANAGYYQFSQPAPDSQAVLRVQNVDTQSKASPAIEIPLSNPFQALRQLRATVYSGNSVELFWENAPSDYIVWRNGEAIARVNGSSYYDSNVQPGVEYRYHVTQGRNASGLELGRSTTLPIDSPFFGCIDFCADYWYFEYSDYFYSQCVQNGVADNRTGFFRSLFPASTDELLVVTDASGVDFSTPFVDVVDSCGVANDFRVISGGYQQYSKTALELFWGRADHPSGVVAYEISLFDQLLSTVDATSYFVDNLGDEVLYEYKVTAIAGDGSRSIPSIYSIYLPENDTGYIDQALEPPVSANVRAEVYSSTAAELFWDEVYDSSGYPVEYRVSRNGELLQTTDGKSYFDASLQSGKNYTYEVVTISQAGIYGNASTIEIITPSVGGAGPGGATLPTGARGQVYSNNALELFWDKPNDDSVSYFVISRNDEPLAETDGASYYSAGLDASTNYRYSIQAKDRDGNNVGEAAQVILKTKQ